MALLYSESSYEYRFNDQHWNTYAEARKAEEYVSNVDNPEGLLIAFARMVASASGKLILKIT